MNQRYRMYRREGGVYYLFDRLTNKRESLGTDDPKTALRLLHTQNEAQQAPIINRQIARAYLTAGDPEMGRRTWGTVMDEVIKTKRDATYERWLRAAKDHAYDLIREVVVFETRPEQFLRVLERGTVATNVFLRRLHNFALDLGWLPLPVLPKRQWPKVQYGPKRAITLEEHRRIVAREQNPERRAFYELSWLLGGSQSDIACLNAEDIDWRQCIVSYRRKKTKSVAMLHFGDQVAEQLHRLPKSGPLFPYLRRVRATDRATEFKQRCRGLGISGVTLHSYRYSWAERAKIAGYPERYAQQALGHNSQAVHRAYAKNAKVVLPSLESFEQTAREQNVVEFPGPAGRDQQPLTGGGA